MQQQKQTRRCATRSSTTKRCTTRSLTRYVVFSIACLILYTSVAMYFLWLEKPLDDALTTGVYGFFGGEIVICALIKLFKLKGVRE